MLHVVLLLFVGTLDDLTDKFTQFVHSVYFS